MTYEIGLGLSRYAEKIRGLTRAVFYNYNPFYEKYPRGTGKMAASAARSRINTARARTPLSSFDIPYLVPSEARKGILPIKPSSMFLP